MERVGRRRVEGEAGSPGDHLGSGRGGQALANRIAARRGVTMRPTRDGVADGPVAGAAAEIALEGNAEIPLLALVEGGRGHDHARRTEAALEALGCQEGRLHRVQGVGRRILRPAGPGQTLDGRDAAPLGPEGWEQAAMHGLAIQMDRAGAAIARVAAFLHPEPASLAQIGAQALPGARRAIVPLAVDREPHAGAPSASASRISPARCWVMCRRQSGAPCTSS